MSAETWTNYAYRCDGADGRCAAISPVSEKSYEDARRKAEAEGWSINHDHLTDLCYAHRPRPLAG